MNRRLGPATVLAVAIVAAVPATASAAKGFQYGVTASEVTQNTALLWTRAPKSGKVTVTVGTNRTLSGRGVVLRRGGRASKSHDNTVRITVRGLTPGKTYFYRFSQGRQVSSVARFIAAPKVTSARPFKFAYSGDADAQRAPGASGPFYNNFDAYKSMANERNDFNINLGDTIYSDSEVPGAGAPATTVPAKWAKYKQNLAMPNLQFVREETSMFNHWDDHEFINDFTPPENGNAIYKAGVRAFTDYMPVTFRARTGIYRTVQWGKNAQLFFLDERSFRSAKASANHQCDNPQTGQPDLAPTAPQSTRNTFAVVDPSFSQPVSQQCKDAINDPNRTLLGKSQLAAFENAVKRSKATWKIVINEVPIQQFYALPYDRWEGYAAERQQVLHTLAGDGNVVVLTTDTHANMYNDARYQTLEEGGPQDSGIPEMITGPVATMTFSQEIDSATGHPGNGALVTSAFFKPQPPNGVGMKCYQTNSFSYTEVQVSRRALVLRPKDLNGNPLANPDGSPCGPFTLTPR